MRGKYILPLLLSIMLFAGVSCTDSGPQATLDKMARAMNANNPADFMAEINMPVFTDNYIKNFTRNSPIPLNSLNELGNMFGLGNLDDLIGSIVDFKAHIQDNFERGVASGELMAQCKTATTPDCPWYPESLRNAQIVELNETAAIAKVTTPAKLTSWLCLRKGDAGWQVVGMAVMESTAREIALANPQQPKTQSNGKPVKI